MTLRDVLLVVGAMPLLGVIVLRLGAEMGLVVDAPPPEALSLALAGFAVVFVVYVALTLRAIAHATRAILQREREEPAQRTAAVSDFAIHLDRSAEVDLREEPAARSRAVEAPGAPAAASAPPRKELFGEVNDLLTRIPSVRPR
jgi:hypothetical protein